MLIQNEDDHQTTGLVNGSVGRVISFHHPDRCLKTLPAGTRPFIGFKGAKKMWVPFEEPKVELEYPLVEVSSVCKHHVAMRQKG